MLSSLLLLMPSSESSPPLFRVLFRVSTIFGGSIAAEDSTFASSFAGRTISSVSAAGSGWALVPPQTLLFQTESLLRLRCLFAKALMVLALTSVWSPPLPF